MEQSIFTAYTFGVIITVILNLYNFLLKPYLKSDKLFMHWNYIYSTWIIIVISILVNFKYPKTALWLTNTSTSLYIFFQFKFLFILYKKGKKYLKVLIVLTIVHFIYLRFFSTTHNSLFFRAISNNAIFFIANVLIGYKFSEIPIKSKIKSIVVMSFYLLSMVWFSRLIMFFISPSQSLVDKNTLNFVSLFLVVPIITLQNISVLLYAFDKNHTDTTRIKKRNINLQNDAVFSSFLNSLFHEINTPLGIAYTASSTHVENKKISIEIKETFDLIHNSLGRVIALLDDKKLIFGDNNLSKKPYLKSVINEIILRSTTQNFLTKNIKLEIDMKEEIYHLSLKRLFTILLYLLELFQSMNIKNRVVFSLLKNSVLEIKLKDTRIFPLDLFKTLTLPDDDIELENYDKDLAEKMQWLSAYVSSDAGKDLSISHVKNDEIYRINI